MALTKLVAFASNSLKAMDSPGAFSCTVMGAEAELCGAIRAGKPHAKALPVLCVWTVGAWFWSVVTGAGPEL